MKNRSCPDKIACWDYDANNCENCAVGNLILRQKKSIKRLKSELEMYKRALRGARDNAVELPAKVMINRSSYCAFRPDCRHEGATCFENCFRQAEKELADEGSAV